MSAVGGPGAGRRGGFPRLSDFFPKQTEQTAAGVVLRTSAELGPSVLSGSFVRLGRGARRLVAEDAYLFSGGHVYMFIVNPRVTGYYKCDQPACCHDDRGPSWSEAFLILFTLVYLC